jgi:hypothetical protein
MKQGEKALPWLAAGLVWIVGTMSVLAVSTDNPYGAIVARNPFALKPPPPPGPDPASLKPPAPKIVLNGIATVFGVKRAIMKMTPPAAKGEQAKEQSFLLAEGEREGELEVMKIDDAPPGSVLVNNYGTVTNLTFEANGPKGGSSPGAPSPTYGGIPAPGAPPAFNPAGGGLRTIPTRALRLPGVNQAPAAGGTPSPYGATDATSGTPNYGYGGVPAAYGQPQQQNPTEQMSPEARALLTEAAYQDAKQRGDATAAIFPPSALDPTRNATPQPGINPTGEGPDNGNPQQPQNPRFQRPWRPGMPSGM